MTYFGAAISLAFVLTGQTHESSIGTLETTLRSQSPAVLAAEARRLGDARRGAVVFYQPALTCTKCHVSDTGAPALGPDLTALGKDVADVYLVESILEPSKVIKKGYETVTISTDDGRTLTGLLGEDRADAVVLRDPGQDGKLVTIPKNQIEERKDGGAVDHAGGPGEQPGLAAAVPRPGALPDGDRREGPGAGPRAASPTRRCWRLHPCPSTSATSTTPG